MAKYIDYPANGYVKNMEFTAIEVVDLEGESWAKTPSGWVCIYNENGVYCQKV